MERLFIYLFIGLVLFSGVLFYLFKRVFVDSSEESIFGISSNEPIFADSVTPAQREHVIYQEEQDSILVAAIKKAPKTVMTTILIQLSLMMFTGYLSVQNIERLAMAGSALVQGDYGMVAASLWPMGKDAVVEQARVGRGVHPYLDEKGLTGFVYTGQFSGKKIALMEHLYRTQDHDKSLKSSNQAYGQVIVGLSATKADEICKDNYGGRLITAEEWKFSRGNFLAARNIAEYPTIPEWTRDVSPGDSDDYYVIAKKSGVWESVLKKNIDHEDGGYVDENDLSNAGFRCSVTWK